MLSKYKRSSIIGIGAGVIAFLAGVALITSSETPEAIPRVVGMLPAAGYILLIWGCRAWAKGKGYHGAWGLLGLMHVFGPIVVACFPDRFRSDRISSSTNPSLLISALEDDAENIRSRAAASLGETGDPRAVDALIRALEDRDSGVRASAAMALGKLKDSRAIEPLVAELHKADRGVRRNIATVLGQIEDAQAVEPLVDLLADSDSDVRQRAAEALRELNWTPSEAMDDDKAMAYFITVGDWGMCSRIGAAAVEPLTEVLAAGRMDRDVDREIITTLGEIGDPRAVSTLVEYVGDRQRGTQAREALSRMGGAAFEPLLEALQSSSLAIRDGAAAALGMIGDPRAVEPLAGALVYGRTPQAAEALARLGDPRAIDPLVEAYNHTDIAIRRAALQALRAFGDKRSDVKHLLDEHDAREAMEQERRRREEAEALRELIQRVRVGMSLTEAIGVLGEPTIHTSGGDILAGPREIIASEEAMAMMSSRDYYTWNRPEGKWQLVFSGGQLAEIYSSPEPPLVSQGSVRADGVEHECKACNRTFPWSRGNPQALSQKEQLICAKEDLPFPLMKKVTCPHCETQSLVRDPNL